MKLDTKAFANAAELLASQEVSEAEMYRTALIMNSYWFPDEYATIARHIGLRGLTLAEADPKEILGRGYSSASGFRRVASLAPQDTNHGNQGGCGL